LKVRKTASDMANYDATTTTEWQNLMRTIRKNIDNVAKETIPWLKDLDSIYVDKLNEFNDAVRDLVYKWWDTKWEWRSNLESIISNLDKPNRALLLWRLEEVVPWVWSRIEAINNLQKLYKSMNQIPSSSFIVFNIINSFIRISFIYHSIKFFRLIRVRL